MNFSGIAGSNWNLMFNQQADCHRPDSNKFNAKKQQSKISKEDTAAKTIQKHTRDYLNGKGVLSHASLPAYKKLCDWEITKNMERAQSGNTRVYFPASHPEVILKLSRNECETRLSQMLDVRKKLDQLKCSHLIIPKAIKFNGYLIEDRLPVNTDSFHNMHCYISEPELFDDAVRDMVRLSSKYYLTDIIGYGIHPKNHIPGAEGSPRYDNIPLYFVTENGQKKGMIGLIDLEHMSPPDHASALLDLARIFPFHHKVIKEEAARMGMAFDQGALDKAADTGKKYIETVYLNHARYLKEKGVSGNAREWLFHVGEKRLIVLKKLVKDELLKINMGDNPVFEKKGYCDSGSKEILVGNNDLSAEKLSEEITQKIIASIGKVMKDHIDEEKCGKDLSRLDDHQMICLRSLYVKRIVFHDEVTDIIVNSSFVDDDKLKYSEELLISEQLVHIVMAELIKGEEIFYYDPAYYTGGHNMCWLRY